MESARTARHQGTGRKPQPAAPAQGPGEAVGKAFTLETDWSGAMRRRRDGRREKRSSTLLTATGIGRSPPGGHRQRGRQQAVDDGLRTRAAQRHAFATRGYGPRLRGGQPRIERQGAPAPSEASMPLHSRPLAGNAAVAARALPYALSLRISSASTHSARFRLTLPSMPLTSRVRMRCPLAARPIRPPRVEFS